jgi:MFS family permease
MSSIGSNPAARRLFAISIVARLPLAMLGIGLLVHAQHLTGSLVAAGSATGAYALGLAAGGPLLGRLADRRGQTAVLLASGGASALLLCAAGALPVGAPAPALVALAAAIGASTPPVGACVRTLLPGLLADDGSVRAAYAVDASVVELTWVAGPPLVLTTGALLSSGAALAMAGLVLLASTAAFAAQPASRRIPPVAAVRERGGSLRSPAVRTLVLALLGVGALLGAAEVAVTAAATALGSTAAAGPLLALWGAGSLAGGLIAARAGGGARTGGGLALVLAALAAGHLALAAAAASLIALGAALFVAGAAIAPAYATVYAMVERAAPAGTLTEAFAWLATAAAVGGALGSAVAGALAEAAGPQAAFGLAGAAGALAVVAVLAGARTLDGAPVAGAAVAPAL